MCAGLFHNVIGESGVFLYPSIAEVLPLGAALAAKLNCSNVADPASCLMAVPASEVMLVRNAPRCFYEPTA